MQKVLIIEDDVSIADLEMDYLQINGFEVDIENNGDSGLAKALNEDYNLIILDLMLPGIGGFEICKKIRAQKEIPIIIVSAKKEDVDKMRGLGLGADDYMTKPFSPNEMVARVKAHISRYERLKSGNSIIDKEIIEVRGISVDKTARKVYVNGKEIEFTSKEYELLLLLLNNPNRVFSKEELYERIWGLDPVGGIATVTVHVRRLREKIEFDPSNPEYIETIWGIGYRFTL
ncbi:response regulator transcription factor [Clostridium folliculivorans]|uniref:Stage 0 sporulation protein A homolog n=1 Tax=Clostridium folliculivorans TaxID=2886038 RepID=A0A9W5Y1C1_9CLOT|nr:response regulator transcription factor [Clostridium folliculivorans]GKU24682.1 DNA-binding response regulator [Clostridium folliculivorans]GKU30780.1 DNA-binding response regulator [Clostridium folliculivorans]